MEVGKNIETLAVTLEYLFPQNPGKRSDMFQPKSRKFLSLQCENALIFIVGGKVQLKSLNSVNNFLTLWFYVKP